MADTKGNRYGSAARYAGLGIQWAVLLGLAVWGGLKLDEKLRFKALFVIIFPLLALGLSLWQLIRELGRKQD